MPTVVFPFSPSASGIVATGQNGDGDVFDLGKGHVTRLSCENAIFMYKFVGFLALFLFCCLRFYTETFSKYSIMNTAKNINFFVKKCMILHLKMCNSTTFLVLCHFFSLINNII